MSLLLCNNFKLVNILRLLSSRSTSHSFRSRCVNVGTNRLFQNKLYATAAYNYKENYSSNGFEKNNYKSRDLSIRNPADIDGTLRDINDVVRRTGRSILESVHTVFQAIENVGSATETQSLYLLRSCGILLFETPNKRVELVNKVWDKFKSLGVKFDNRHFNALLKVYLDSNENFSPSDILISMEQSNVEPNQETYCYLIEKYCRDGNLNGANGILEYLKEKNIPVNEAIFNSLIKGQMKVNDVEGAKDIMEFMRKSNYTPSSLTYSTLACSFADIKDFNELEKLLSEADSLKIPFSIYQNLQILISVASNGNEELVDKMLQKIDDVYNWRQDFINAAAELVHKGLDGTAHKLIMKVSSPKYSTATNHFLRLLIKAEIPTERVMRYCNEIFLGYNSYVFTIGAMISAESGKVDHAIAFFDQMQDKGMPVRIQYFRPLLISNKHYPEGVWKLMKKIAELGLSLDYLHYKKHILPTIGNEEPEQLISKIEELGHSVACVIDPLFEYYCSQGKIDYAHYLIENHPVKVNMYFDLVHFLSLYYKFSKNESTYFNVLKYILENIGLPGQDTEALRGEQLAVFLQTNPRLFELFHKSPMGKECKYSSRSLGICKKNIRGKAPDLVRFLRYIENPKAVSSTIKEISLEEENKLIDNAPSNRDTLMELLILHIKNRDIERVNLIKSKFDGQDFILPPTIYVQIFFLECEMDQLEAAKQSFQKLKENYPTFKIDTSRLIDYARLLLKYSNITEATAIIENECQEVTNFTGSSGTMLKSLGRFLNNMVQTGNIDCAKAVQSLLINKAGFSEFKAVLLEPVLKIYLYQEDFENSLKEYEKCVLNHQCAPCQELFMKKLILADENTKLQAVVDLTSKVEGNLKTLHKLGIIFLELDHLQQATKVFKRLGRAIDYGYLQEVAEEYIKMNNITMFENLLRATSSIKIAGRKELSELLSANYCKKKQFEKSFKILDSMKDDNIDAIIEQKLLIDKLCSLNKKPLDLPEINSRSDPSTSKTLNTQQTVPFLNFVQQGQVVEALKELEALKKGYIKTIPSKVMSDFIGLLVKDNCLNNLVTNTPAMGFIIENSSEIFKPLLEKYSEEGNIEAMKSLANTFPDFALQKCAFSSFLGHAYINTNQLEDFLEELEARSQMKHKLFSMVAFQELLKMSHLEDRCVNLAKSYLSTNYVFPLTLVWFHYLKSKQYEKAQEISRLAMLPVDKIDSMVFRQVQETENVELGKKYVEFVSAHEYRPRIKERAYGILLDFLVLKQMHDDAVNLVMDAKSNNVDLEKHYRSTLINLKNSLERENKPVPFSVDAESVS